MAGKFTRRAILKTTAALGAGVFLPNIVRAAPRRGGKLAVATPYNPSTLDPITGRNLPDLDSLYCIFDGLFELEPSTLAVKPGLARAWKFTDPKTLVLDLVENAKFHDGTAFDAEAVKFNLERTRTDKRSSVKNDVSSIESVEVASRYQAVLHLNRPNAGLPTVLGDRAGLMVSPTAVQARGGDIDRNPVGTGAWKFVSWEDNHQLVLTRNEVYWKPGLPYLDAVTLSIITEFNTALRSVTALENDLVIALQTAQKPIADRAPGVVAVLAPSLGIFTTYLNYARPPLDDLRVRQALNYALDRNALNTVVSYGLDRPTCAILPKEHWAADPATLMYYGHDPGKARSLLAAAGYGNGLDLPMLGWSDQMSMKRQEVVVAQLAEVGVRVQLTPGSPADTAAKFFGPEKIGAARMSTWGGRPDPSQNYGQLFGKGSYYNAGGGETPGVQDLLALTERTFDQTERAAAFHQLQRLVVEQALMMPVLATSDVAVHKPSLKNVEISLIGRTRLHEVYFES